MSSSPFKSKSGFSIDGKANILQGTVSPTSGAGLSAPISSLYLRDLGSSSETWQKTGSADTAWMLISSTTSTEDPNQNAYTGKTGLGSELPQYGTPKVVANNDTLVAAIGKLDQKFGDAPSAETRTNNPISGTGTVQNNIDKLDAAIGGDLASTNYAKNNQTVGQNLSALDSQTKANSDAISALQTGNHWIDAVKFVTSENLTARSGLAKFTDDQVPYTFPVAGNRVVSTFDNKLYIASAGAWLPGVALNNGDTFFTENDLLATEANREKTAAYHFNGTTLVREASFDFEAADSIDLTGTYVAASGDPAPGDSVQAAIAKIDGNQDATIQALGVGQGHTNLGTWTGTGATRILTNGAESAKTAIQKVANELGGTAGGSGNYVSNQSVNANLNAIDAALTQAHAKVTVNNVVSDVNTDIDTVDLTGEGKFVEWDVTLVQSTNTGNVYSSKFKAIASANGSDSVEYAILTIGSAIANVVISIDASTLSATKLKVQATVTGGYHVKLVRRIGSF